MKKVIMILFVFLVSTACSQIEQIPTLDETSRGGESINFLDKDTVFLSVNGGSAEVKSKKGYFFHLSYVYAIQGRDTTKYRRGDNGEYAVEDSTYLQVIEGNWYTIRTFSDKEAQEWGCGPILPVKINIMVAPNTSSHPRKLIMEAIQGNSFNYLYVIQHEK